MDTLCYGSQPRISFLSKTQILSCGYRLLHDGFLHNVVEKTLFVHVAAMEDLHLVWTSTPLVSRLVRITSCEKGSKFLDTFSAYNELGVPMASMDYLLETNKGKIGCDGNEGKKVGKSSK